MTRRSFCSALTLLLASSPVVAKAPTLTYKATVGVAKISIPVPTGFVEPTEQSPKLRQFGEAFTQKTHRLIGFFVTDEDLKLSLSGEQPLLDSYFMVAALHRAEQDVVNPRQFDYLRKMLHDQHQQIFKQSKAQVQSDLSKSTKGTEFESMVASSTIKVGDTRPLEIIDERQNSISILAVAKYSNGSNDQNREMVVALTTTTILTNGKILYLYGCRRYRTPEDVVWLRRKSLDWLSKFGR